MYSNPDLLIVNLLIGMCRGSRGLPRVLMDLGYRDRWIPRCFPGPDRDSVPPVFCVTSHETRHTLFVEVRAGPDIEAARLARYSRVTAADLRQDTSLSREQTETYDIAVFGLAQHRQSLIEGLAGGGHRFPLLLLNETGLTLAANSFAKAALNNVFLPPLELDWSSVPRSWIPFDGGSGLAEVAEAVIPEAVASAIRGESRIELSDLCRGQASWGISGTRDRDRLGARVREVLAMAAAEEFSGHFRLEGMVLKVVGGRAGASHIRRPQTLKKLLQLQGAFLGRIGAGSPGRGQRELFVADGSPDS